MKDDIRAKYRLCRLLSLFFEDLGAWREAREAAGSSCAFSQTEYDDLLKGTNAHVYVPLWTSCAKGNAKLLCSEVTLEVIKFYKRCGYRAILMDGNPADYIGEELRFLSYLYACGCAGDADAAIEAEAFTDLFFADTVKAFCGAAASEEILKWVSAASARELERISELLSAAVSGNAQDLREGCEGPDAPEGFRRAPEIELEPLRKVLIANPNDCGAKCQMTATVQENCLLGTQACKDHMPFTGCPRGRSYRYTFLTADRLRYPMVRRGRRGEGLFRRISWQEAQRMAADAIRSTGERFGPGSRYVSNASGVSAALRGDRFIRRLMDFCGGYLESYNYYSATCVADMMELTYGDTEGGSDFSEYENAELIVLWGHNPAENLYGPFHNLAIARAKEKGVPIVAVDPRASESVLTLADEWIPIKPSSDAAMRSINAVSIATFLTSSRKVSFDTVVEAMYQTGLDINSRYRETAEGGLARFYRPGE